MIILQWKEVKQEKSNNRDVCEVPLKDWNSCKVVNDSNYIKHL